MLSFKTITLLSADLPKENIIPDIKGADSLPFFKLDGSVPQDNGLLLGQGMVPSVLPYTMQSLYDRDFKPLTYHAAILENEYIRATFLPELGGRLWSLYDKRLNRELLYKNKVIAFANLALRNAWFAGGVEWNIGVRGHTHYTCAPLFTCKEVNSSGDEILKMYEYEPIRGLAYVIRAGVFKDELRVNVTIENTKNKPTYIYWWSNIAVPQTKGTRVFVPADKTYVTTYRDGGYLISRSNSPVVDGHDVSYPAYAKTAKDYFFDIPKENKKWIASVDGDGLGLLQSSDRTLIGRKLFVWGNINGGRHWNDWLTDGGEYAEIQAGLAKTQFEHIPMQAKAKISWNECYRSISVDGKDGDYREICRDIDRTVSECDFGDFFVAVDSTAPIIRGSGHGALAAMLSPDEAATVCTFTKDGISDGEAYFSALINGTHYTDSDSLAYATDLRYLDLIDAKESKTDFDRYMSGVIAIANGSTERAEAEFSLVKGKYEWLALACLALISTNLKKDLNAGYEYITRALEQKKNDTSLLVLFCEISLKAQQYGHLADVTENINIGRIKMYRASALVELGRLDEAKSILSTSLIIPDIREGEYSLFAIWVKLYGRIIARDEHRTLRDITESEVLQKYPIPYELDFRMH